MSMAVPLPDLNYRRRVLLDSKNLQAPLNKPNPGSVGRLAFIFTSGLCVAERLLKVALENLW